jgi:hypothetical protein
MPAEGGGFLSGWWVVVGFVQDFLHRVFHEEIFEKNPPQPSTLAKPTTIRRRGTLILFGAPYRRLGICVAPRRL